MSCLGNNWFVATLVPVLSAHCARGRARAVAVVAVAAGAAEPAQIAPAPPPSAGAAGAPSPIVNAGRYSFVTMSSNCFHHGCGAVEI